MTMPATRLKTLLIVSVVLNVFLLGAIAGGTYRWMEKQKADVIAQQRGLRFAAAELPEARREQLRDALRQTRRDSLPLIIGARSGRLDVVQALAAPQFDRERARCSARPHAGSGCGGACTRRRNGGRIRKHADAG